MSKGAYKPTRDRRKTQPGLPGGFVAAIYQLILDDVQAELGQIFLAAQMRNGLAEPPTPIDAFAKMEEIPEIGIQLRQGLTILEIEVSILNDNMLLVQTVPLDGFYVLYIPAGKRELQAPNGAICSGAIINIESED